MTKKWTLKILALSLSILLIAPFGSTVLAAENEPTIVSQAAIVMDYDTGEIIYEKNANDKHFIASTTKLMTSLLFSENAKKTDTLTYSQDAYEQPPYTLNSNYGNRLKVGSTMNADDAMKALMLFSANDIAYMIADHVGKDTASFVDMMNKKAASMGLKNTHFENPNGVPVNGNDVNYSTAYELAIIARAAFKNDWVRQTMQLDKARITLPVNVPIDLTNRNTALNKDGNIGGKTGVTDQAGTCFAGIYERNGKKYVAVVLKCDRNNDEKRFQDSKAIVDYAEKANKVVYKKSGAKVATANLQYKLFRFFGPTKTITAPIILKEDAKIYDNDINKKEVKISYSETNKNAWQVASEKNTKLTMSIKDYSTSLKGEIQLTTGKLLTANIGIYLATLAVIIIVLVLIIIIIKLMKSVGNNKKRRRYSSKR